MEREPHEELLRLLGRFPPEIVDLMLCCRHKLYEFAPDATEFILNVPYTVACNYTFTHSVKQSAIYIAAYSKHVNFGFVFGANLADPEGRLKGDGKSMRHIQIRESKNLDDPYLDEIIVQALKEASRPPEPLKPKTVISGSKIK